MDRNDMKFFFERMHPGFFEKKWIRSMPEDYVYEEMILDLKTFFPPSLPVPEGITFGLFDGDWEALRQSVAEVDKTWTHYYVEGSKAYCACDGERVVSFCLADEFVTVERGVRTIRIGGPGCVGTVPDHRRRGIGLKFVENATLLLKQGGFDYSWIHYTGVAPWYAKLGYTTVLRWNGKGFLD